VRERDIFIEALQKAAPADVDAYLDATCGGDAELRSRVDELLAEHRRQGKLHPRRAPRPGMGATIDQPLTELPSTLIGPYKLLQQIGEGGMGIVFLAEQQRPVRRQVALKGDQGRHGHPPGRRPLRIRAAGPGPDGPPQHRQSPRCGATDTGRPYFVMELVKGVPLTKYCDAQRLTPRARLELFIQVLPGRPARPPERASSTATFKPSNVLIALYDGKPVPKVIDFGVAKATGQRLTERTMFTGFGDVIGTLEYMSPEQAELNQLDVDTRSDVYSLGVLLYELLTGSTPVEKERVKRTALLEMLRVVREEEPPRPSTAPRDAEQLPGHCRQAAALSRRS